ncbi:alpha-L-glutamate ligase [Streptomyces sp. ISL-36]|uniref:alpha-L-glutamate ligase n=1 Tax=Streptomyces sp. ISL-36 TaxID=2819182 RepID=UPI0027E3CB8F|nr:alpha-L-glutamate ligase [Streptomyces sp. ISL-36]
MIVFYGWQNETPLAQAIQAARQAGADHHVVDQAQLHRYDLMTRLPESDGWLAADGVRIALDEITAVYARPLHPPAHAKDPAERARVAALHQEFVDWLDRAQALVLNRPQAMASNASKPYQSQFIAAAGFLVPETLVTNDPDDVREFQACHGRVVYKSLSGVRSIVRELGPADMDRLDRVRRLPTQFQEYVPGTDVRVHVVGERTFAAEVDCAATDYRYAAQDGLEAVLRPRELPADVAARCVRLAGDLGLPFAGLDLRVRPDGGWVCFEANPMPAYSYFQDAAGLPISTALVDLLAGAARHPCLTVNQSSNVPPLRSSPLGIRRFERRVSGSRNTSPSR